MTMITDMRFYAQSGEDRNYQLDLGVLYLWRTLHADKEERSRWPWSGDCDALYWSWELVEDWWVDRIEDNLTGSPYHWTC